ncbi:MAG: hypothetical protein IT427_18460 [Pirellulales bacterium]|nr:hypothetical protein [Pirellulales bacterium]
MSNLAPERLLGYLLDACEADERQQIEQHLQQDESLRRQCELLNKAIAPLACDKAHLEPPQGLAQRCCEHVFARLELMPAALSPLGGAAVIGGRGRRWSWLDVSVAAAVAAAVLFLIGPAIFQARQQALRLTCQDNLRDIGTALSSYSNLHEGMYPSLPQRGGAAYAGMSWGPMLKDHLSGDDRMLCPSSPSPCKSQQEYVPRLDRLQGMTDDQIKAALPQLASIYGFTLGYDDGVQYRVHRNHRRAHFAVGSDPPGPGASNSLNHGGQGQNVLFEDGSVKFVTSVHPFKDDDIFSNGHGNVAPGTGENDSVIVPGHFLIRIRVQALREQ